MAISVIIKNQRVMVGDTVSVTQQFQEEDKTRSQIFEGTVIAIKGQGSGRSFTLRKISAANIGVERIWPVNSPSITKVMIIKHGKVRRAKLYYLRDRIGKQALKVKATDQIQVNQTKKLKKTSGLKQTRKNR